MIHAQPEDGKIPPLTKSDVESHVMESCSTVAHHPGELVHQLVGRHALGAPEAVALVSGSDSLTYGGLEKEANRLAHYLRSLSVGRETIVGVCMERSLDQIVGALAVLKAGGAYLPMDPAYPAQRLTHMMEDSQARILLTQDHLSERLQRGGWRIVSIDGGDQDEIGKQPSGAPVSSICGEHLAYVIYTSGSTGVPKGVAISHGSLLNLIFWHQQTFEVTSKDRATYAASLSFDASVWELWPYLTAGASIHLPPESVRNAPEPLRDWLAAQGITIGFAPTPMAERLIALKWPPDTPLRILLTGGDALLHFPPPGLPFRLVNNYGPTECTVVATSGLVPAGNGCSGFPTIGRPIANVRIQILDQNLEPVPDGASGEIFIGGLGLARGYLNRPELTAERFILDPAGAAQHERMYRTGDLGKFLPGGEVAFLGRLDDQVKIRGFRVELGEITCELKQHPSIQDAAVVAQELTDGEKSLVAYIVPAPGAQANASELKAALRGRLPDYMVPARFVRLHSLPLTPSGKVDRRALPAPTAGNTLRDDPFVAPRTPMEQRVAEILASLLGLESIGVEDNFFMLGGHSLLGTQVIARMRAAFGVDLSLRDIFDAATVAELAGEVERLLVAKLDGSATSRPSTN